MKRIGKILRVMGKAMKLIFIAFCIYTGSLLFRQQELPAEWIEDRLQERLPENLVLHLGGGSFGFRDGLTLTDVKLYNKARKDALSPMVAVERASINLLTRRVHLVAPYYDKLPDGYYEPGYAYGPRSQLKEAPPPWDFRLPRLPKFRLTAERPDILGIKPERVEGEVTVNPTRAEINNIKVKWPRQTALPMTVDGYIYFDIAEKHLAGECEGLATQAFIRPHLVILDIPVCLPYVDAFTGVQGPIPAYFAWDVNLDTGKTVLDLGLHPTLGAYRKVPMKRADGVLKIEVWYRDGFMESDIHIGPITAYDNSGRMLEGGFIVHRQGPNDDITLEVDAKSELKKDDILEIIDCLNDGTLDDFKCETPLKVWVKGFLATEDERQAANDLRGEMAVERCEIFNIAMENAQTEYEYKGDELTFKNATAKGSLGGELSAWAKFKLPAMESDKASVELDVNYRKGSVEEVADFFDFDLGDRKGKMEGSIHLSGPLTTNLLSKANGYGRINIEDGHLAQMKLFAGMTSALAEYVPGVGTIVNQNTGSCTFTIEDGVLKTDDLIIEGSLFSISAKGTYDIANDNLDFTVLTQFTRKESMLGKYLIRPIMWTFSKLLMEYKVRGPMDHAEWDYQGILDRVGL